VFAKESLDALRSRVDLVEVIQSYMPLKRAGAAFKACCPFHEERTPSFTVQRGDTHFHCFGCGAHGDAIAFLMQYLKLSFRESVETLAQRYNIVLQRTEKEEGDVPRRRLKDLLEKATRLCHYALLHTSEGHQALDYLYKRGCALDFLRSFQIGYWPGGRQILQLLREGGATEDDLRLAGLLTQHGRELFADRITFPVRNPAGEVIGFSARKFKEETTGGKYVNSPETPLFKKSQVLFGLSYCRRRIAKERRIVLVEGQVDALMLIHAGFNLTVATQGTAFADGHLKELQNLGVQEAWLLFDSDRAGREAACKVGNLLQSEGIRLRVARLPNEMDPDEALRALGPDVVRKALAEAQDYLSFLVQEYRSNHPLEDPATKAQVADQIAKQIREWKQPVMVHESLKKLATLLAVPEHLIGVGDAPKVARQPRMKLPPVVVDQDLPIEADLLRWFLWLGSSQPQVIAKVLQALPADALRHPTAKRLYQAFHNVQARGETLDLFAVAAETQDDELVQFVDALMEKRLPLEKGETLVSVTVKRLLERNWLAACETIRLRLSAGDVPEEEAMRLAKEYGQMRKSPPHFS
jgi:DNA primase